MTERQSPQTLAEDPVEVIDDWKGSTGLVRPDFFDWPARIEHDMAAEQLRRRRPLAGSRRAPAVRLR